jgi:hypothetical protein
MLRGIAIALTAAAATGCATMPMMSQKMHDKWESMKRRPNKMIVSVAPNYIEKDGFPYHQGLLARVHFFLNDEPMTMPAEGEMTFVAYDKAKASDKTVPEPVGVYKITNEEMAKHQTKDIIGVSYAFWLPYEPDAQTQMIVNATFVPTYGAPYTAEPATVSLTPLKNSVAAANTAEKRRPRPNYVSFDSIGPKSKGTVSTLPLNKPGLPNNALQPTGGVFTQPAARPPQ